MTYVLSIYGLRRQINYAELDWLIHNLYTCVSPKNCRLDGYTHAGLCSNAVDNNTRQERGTLRRIEGDSNETTSDK